MGLHRGHGSGLRKWGAITWCHTHGTGSEWHSKPILFHIKSKPDLGILKSNVIDIVHANPLTPMSLVSCPAFEVNILTVLLGVHCSHMSSTESAFSFQIICMASEAWFATRPFLPLDIGHLLTWNPSENRKWPQEFFYSVRTYDSLADFHQACVHLKRLLCFFYHLCLPLMSYGSFSS